MGKKKLSDCEIIEDKIDEIIQKDVVEILNYSRKLLINKNYIQTNGEEIEIRDTVAMLLFNVLPEYFSYLSDVNTTAIMAVLNAQKPDYAEEMVDEKKNYILTKLIEQIKGL